MDVGAGGQLRQPGLGGGGPQPGAVDVVQDDVQQPARLLRLRCSDILALYMCIGACQTCQSVGRSRCRQCAGHVDRIAIK